MRLGRIVDVDVSELPDDGVIVVLYHPFELVRFPGVEGANFLGVERFGQLLKKLSEVKELEVTTFTDLAQKRQDVTTERYKRANSLWYQRSFWAKILPRDLWPGTKGQDFYLSMDEYSQRLVNWKVATAALMTGLFLAGLLFRWVLGLTGSQKWCFVIDVVASLLFCFAISAEVRVVWRGYHMSGPRALPIFFCLSFVIFLMVRILKRLKLITGECKVGAEVN